MENKTRKFFQPEIATRTTKIFTSMTFQKYKFLPLAYFHKKLSFLSILQMNKKIRTKEELSTTKNDFYSSGKITTKIKFLLIFENIIGFFQLLSQTSR
jgi:hypothetical protein